MPSRLKTGPKPQNNRIKQPTIILIGGVYGAGKTTLAHELAKRLRIYQRAGIGTIIKTLAELSKEYKSKAKNWGEYKGLNRTQTQKKLLSESRLMGKILTVIINRAVKHGQNYIIDGVQMLPQFLPLDKIYFVVLTVSNKREYLHRLTEPGHTRLTQSDGITPAGSVHIEKLILSSALRHRVPIFDNLGSAQAICKRIIHHFKLQPAK